MFHKFDLKHRFTSRGREVGRVVVADAESSLFAMARQLTAPDLWQLEYAETPEALSALFRRGPVQVAIVNLQMLKSNPELAEELTERTRRGLRVVVTTDEHNEANERLARTVGPVHYAPKPLAITMLSDVLDSALVEAV